MNTRGGGATSEGKTDDRDTHVSKRLYFLLGDHDSAPTSVTLTDALID